MKTVAPRLFPSTLPLTDRTPGTRTDAQAARTLLTENAGARRVTFHLNSNASVDLMLSPPPVTQLILSGGGAKGIAFPGVIQALEDKNLLKGVVTICGSSAGGISAALLASGVSATAFSALTNSISFPQLLNSTSSTLASLQNASTALGKMLSHLPGKTGTFSQLLLTVLPRLQSKAEPLEELIRTESRKVILAHIANMTRETRTASIMAIADKLHAGGATTFADLDVLSRHIPEIKQLNITGVGIFGGRQQLVLFNASLTPDMDIARAAHISGALPILFKQPSEQRLAFQQDGQKNAFQDGGLLLNTPDIDIYEPPAHSSPFSAAEKLIVRFEPGAPKTANPKGSFISHAINQLTGLPPDGAKNFAKNRSDSFSEQRVALPLNTALGDFRGTFNGTVNFTMNLSVKHHLQGLSRQAVIEHLDKRAAVRDQHHFASVQDAVLAMDDEMFSSVAPALEKLGGHADILHFRQQAQTSLGSLDAAISEANTAPSLKLTQKLGAALRNLDALARRPEQIEWLGKQLNVAGNCNFQQLLQSDLSKHANLSKVLTSAHAEAKKRNVAVIAENFTREVIYPALFLPGQPETNLNLLRQVEQTLKHATTANEVNQALDDIVNKYVARNKPWKHPQGATTVGLAKAWRMQT